MESLAGYIVNTHDTYFVIDYIQVILFNGGHFIVQCL